MQEKQNAEKNRQAELQAQKERAEADKKLEAERSIALKTQRDKLAQDAAAKASEVRKLKMEKQGVLGQINVIESKKKALVEIRQGVENRSIELYNQMNSDIESEFERITNKSFSTVELGSDGQPTEIALTRRENQRISAYNNLHEKFFADCESVKQATMQQQNALLQEIKQDQTNLTKLRTVNSMGDELRVSFGPYEGSQNGWNTYLSLYSDGILVYTDTVIVSYEAVAGKKAPNMATELNDSVIEEYTNNVDMYNSLLTRGDPILYFEIEYSVKAKSEDKPSEYDFIYKNLKVYNTLSDVVVQNIAINKTESKVMNPKQDLRIFDGIVEKETKKLLFVKDITKEKNVKIETIFFNKDFEKGNIYDVSFLVEVNLVEIPTKNIKMLNTEVTLELFEFLMGKACLNKNIKNGDFRGRGNIRFGDYDYIKEDEIQEKRPIACRYGDAIAFCNKLSILCGLKPVYSVCGETEPEKWDWSRGEYSSYMEHWLTYPIKENQKANGYRLPNIEEWLFAAKGGENYIYAGSENLDEVAWYEDNSITLEDRYRGGPYRGPHQVAKKKSNAYGLYDMIGNVSEWCYEYKEFGKYDICAFALGGNYDSDRNFIPNGEFIVNKKRSGNDKYPEEYQSFLVPRAGFRIVRSIK